MERRKGAFAPLTVTFHLYHDLVLRGHAIRFDALLQYYAMQAEMRTGVVYDAIVTDYALPLRRLCVRNHPNLWFYDCAHGGYETIYIQRDNIKKRINTRGFGRNIRISAGKYCSNIANFERIRADKVTFRAYGDAQVIYALLRDVRHIGALRKDGFGAVSRVEVALSDFAFACWDSESRSLLRDIPAVGDIFDYIRQPVNVRYGRFRPPYNPQYALEQSALIMAGSQYDFMANVEVMR